LILLHLTQTMRNVQSYSWPIFFAMTLRESFGYRSVGHEDASSI
jgi:hypothetical protein